MTRADYVKNEEAITWFYHPNNVSPIIVVTGNLTQETFNPTWESGLTYLINDELIDYRIAHHLGTTLEVMVLDTWATIKHNTPIVHGYNYRIKD